MSYQKSGKKTLTRAQNREQNIAQGRSSTTLHNKPQRRQQKRGSWRTSTILLTLASVLIIGVLAFFFIRLTSPQTPHTATAPISPGGNGTVCVQGQSCATNNSNGGLIEAQPDFISTVQSQVATGLHLSPDQLKTKLQTGMSITDLAQQQGLSLDQWHTLELNAVKTGMQKLISENKLTQDRADTMQQHWNTDPTSMDTSIELMLGGCPGVSGPSGCPSGPGSIGN